MPDKVARQAFAPVILIIDKYTGTALEGAERPIRIPRAPPTLLLSL